MSDLAKYVFERLVPIHSAKTKTVDGHTASKKLLAGERNTGVTSWAGKQLRLMGDVSKEVFKATIRAWAVENTDPTLPTVEADSIAESVWRYREDVNAEPWPDPRVLRQELPPPLPFPDDALLMAPFREFALDDADRMSAPPDYVALALVGFAGGVIGSRVALRPKSRDRWLITANLYTLLVGEPSARKSPAMASIKSLVAYLEERSGEVFDSQLKRHDSELAAFRAQQSALTGAMKSAAKGDALDSERMRSAVDALAALQEPTAPARRRYLTSDSTPEKAKQLLQSSFGLTYEQDEALGALVPLDQEERRPARTLLLKGSDGLSTDWNDRVAAGSQTARICLAFVGCTQPEPYGKWLKRQMAQLGNDGLVQRFHPVYPAQVEWQWTNRAPVEGLRMRVLERFVALSELDPVAAGATPGDDLQPVPSFAFDADAEAIFQEWSTELHKVKIRRERDPMIAQHLGKYEKLFCALALTLHLLESRTGPVRADTALRAAAWCAYLESHARRVYALVEAANVRNAQRICEKLIEWKRPEDSFTVRDCMRWWGSWLDSTAEAEIALTLLVDAGWMRAVDTPDGTVGRHTTRYHINPKCKEPAK